MPQTVAVWRSLWQHIEKTAQVLDAVFARCVDPGKGLGIEQRWCPTRYRPLSVDLPGKRIKPDGVPLCITTFQDTEHFTTCSTEQRLRGIDIRISVITVAQGDAFSSFHPVSQDGRFRASGIGRQDMERPAATTPPPVDRKRLSWPRWRKGSMMLVCIHNRVIRNHYDFPFVYC